MYCEKVRERIVMRCLRAVTVTQCRVWHARRSGCRIGLRYNLVHKMLLASQTLRYAALRMDTLILFLTLQGSYSADTQAYNERCLLYTGLGRDETKTSGACSSPRRPRSCFAAHAQRVQFASSSPTRRLCGVLACLRPQISTHIVARQRLPQGTATTRRTPTTRPSQGQSTRRGTTAAGCAV